MASSGKRRSVKSNSAWHDDGNRQCLTILDARVPATVRRHHFYRRRINAPGRGQDAGKPAYRKPLVPAARRQSRLSHLGFSA